MAEWAEKKKDVTPTPVRIRGHDSLVWSCFTVQIFLCHSVKVFLGCTQTKAGAQPMVDALVVGRSPDMWSVYISEEKGEARWIGP
jgi:hypothetical protein